MMQGILNDNIEKLNVEIEDDRDADRITYGFGDKVGAAIGGRSEPLHVVQGEDVVLQEHDQRQDRN